MIFNTSISISNALMYIILFLAGFFLMDTIDGLFINVDGGVGIKIFVGYLFTIPYSMVKE